MLENVCYDKVCLFYHSHQVTLYEVLFHLNCLCLFLFCKASELSFQVSLWRGNYIIWNLRCSYEFFKRAYNIIHTGKTSRGISWGHTEVFKSITIAPFWFEFLVWTFWLEFLDIFINLASDYLMQFINFTLYTRHFVSDRIAEMFLKITFLTWRRHPFTEDC